MFSHIYGIFKGYMFQMFDLNILNFLLVSTFIKIDIVKNKFQLTCIL
jgi:hypothetical protein